MLGHQHLRVPFNNSQQIKKENSMMQNIKNGKPVVFNHNCPVGRKGVTMNQDEYGSFLEEMVFQCFAFANIELKKH